MDRGLSPRPRSERKERQRPPLWSDPLSQSRRAVSAAAVREHSDVFGECRRCEEWRTAVLTLQKEQLERESASVRESIRAALRGWKRHIKHELPAPLFAAATKPIITKRRIRHLAHWRDTTHQARP